MITNFKQKYFNNIPILSTTEVSIVIPVKNEEASVKDLLLSLAGQVDLDGNKLDDNFFEILILANNCTDNTVPVIQKFQKKNKKLNLHLETVMLEANQANIGYARKTLMDNAYARLMRNGGGLILTTDGDTIVSKNWIAQNLAEISNGADAVGGRILLKEDELQCLDNNTSYFYYKDEEYQLLAAELEARICENFDYGKSCHHQHFNGSFAVTTECYQSSGGVPVVKNLEDCAFYDRLLFIDANVRHSDKVVVRTSGRCIGRTDLGLSQQLNIWKNIDVEKECFFVESSESLLWRFTIKKELKELWKRRYLQGFQIEHELQDLPEMIIFNDKVFSNLQSSTYFGEWFEEIKHLNDHIWREKFQPVEIDEAIKNLRSILDR